MADALPGKAKLVPLCVSVVAGQDQTLLVLGATMRKIHILLLFALCISLSLLFSCKSETEFKGKIVYTNRNELIIYLPREKNEIVIYSTKEDSLTAFPSFDNRGNIVFEECKTLNGKCNLVLLKDNYTDFKVLGEISNVYGFPSISPSGKFIAVQDKIDETENKPKYSILIINERGEVARKLRMITSGSGLGWSPDETKIVFEAFNGKVVILNLIDGEITELISGKSPIFSSDSKNIAFIQAGSIYIYDIDNTDYQVVVNEGPFCHFDVLKKWSMDKKYIIGGMQKIGFRGERYLISVIDLQSKEVKYLKQIYDQRSFDWIE